MNERPHEDLTGHPSDYGSRTLEEEEQELAQRDRGERTADGDPLAERGTADSAVSGESAEDEPT